MESVPFSHRQHFGDIVHVTQQATAEGDGLGPVAFPRTRRSLEARQPFAQRLVDHIAERRVSLLPDPLDQLGDVLVERQRRAHASKHISHDDLMQDSSRRSPPLSLGPQGFNDSRQGPRAVIRIGAAAATVSPIFALVAHLAGGGWLARVYPVVFVSLGIANSTWIMGFFNYVLEIAPEGKRTVYVGTINSIAWPLTLMSVVGGWLLEATSYPVLFATTAAFVGASFLLSLGLKSSRLAPSGRLP